MNDGYNEFGMDERKPNSDSVIQTVSNYNH